MIASLKQVPVLAQKKNRRLLQGQRRNLASGAHWRVASHDDPEPREIAGRISRPASTSCATWSSLARPSSCAGWLATGRRCRRERDSPARAQGLSGAVRCRRSSWKCFSETPQIAGKYYYDDDLKGFNFERKTMSFSSALDTIVVPSVARARRRSMSVRCPSTNACPASAAQYPMPLFEPGRRRAHLVGTCVERLVALRRIREYRVCRGRPGALRLLPGADRPPLYRSDRQYDGGPASELCGVVPTRR